MSKKINIYRKFSVSLLSMSVAVFVSIVSGCGGGGGAPPGLSPSPPTTVPEPMFADLRILIVGQSISANCNQFVYGPSPNVFQIGLDGNVKAASDPFEWADCKTGSMWMPLGQKIIESGVAKKVTFMPIGVGGSGVADWQQDGKSFPKLESAIKLIKEKGLVFDFAFWHQGSSNIGGNKTDYANRLASVVGYINGNVQINRWLIALHSRCWGMYDAGIEESQRIFGMAPEAHRYLGPNTNLLGNEFRVDTCHLNRDGQELMATKWLESMNAALSN